MEGKLKLMWLLINPKTIIRVVTKTIATDIILRPIEVI